VCRKPEQQALYQPDAARHAALQVRLQRYRAIYAPFAPLQGESA